MTVERANEIINAVFGGEAVRRLLPTSTERMHFYELVKENAELANRYARAKEAKAEALFDEIVEIADTELDSQKARNRIDARKFSVSKMNPAQYGDNYNVNLNGHVDISAALADATSRVLRPLRDLRNVEDAEVIETKQLTDSGATGYQPEEHAKDTDGDIFT